MKFAPTLVKETPVTNAEMIQALTALGYRNESTEERYHFVNDRYSSVVSLPPYPLSDVVRKEFVALYSYQLLMQGVIKQAENLVKLSLKIDRRRKHPY